VNVRFCGKFFDWRRSAAVVRALQRHRIWLPPFLRCQQPEFGDMRRIREKKIQPLNQPEGADTTPVARGPIIRLLRKRIVSLLSASPETLLELRDAFGYGDGRIIELNMRFKRVGRGAWAVPAVENDPLMRLIGGLVKAKRGQVLSAARTIGTQTPDALRVRRQDGQLFSFFRAVHRPIYSINVVPRCNPDPEELLRDRVMKLNAVGFACGRSRRGDLGRHGSPRGVARAIASIQHDVRRPFAGLDPISLGIRLIVDAEQRVRRSLLRDARLPESAPHCRITCISSANVRRSAVRHPVAVRILDPSIRQFYFDGGAGRAVKFHYPSTTPLARTLTRSKA